MTAHQHISDFQQGFDMLRDAYYPRMDSSSRYVKVHKADTNLDISLRVSGPRNSPIVRVRHGGALAVETDLHDVAIIKQCVTGTGSVRQRGEKATWLPGMVIPMGHLEHTRFDFSREFASLSLAVDSRRLESLCSSWLGYPLETALRLALVPFSDTLLRAWNSTLSFMESISASEHELPSAAEAALDEFVLTLLLRSHPHNYSEELQRPERDPGSRLVRRAVRFVEEHSSSDLTVAKLAEGVGASVRTLQAGFRHWRDITPTEYLRSVRLQRVRDELLQADSATTVTGVALDHGFLHLGRFSQHYKSAFHECPAATLAKGRRLAS